MKMKRLSFYLVCILLPMLLSTFVYHSSTASGIVGTGTADSCTEAALDAALAGGGSINFYCGSAPVVIPVTKEKTIAQNTKLDGNGIVTISGKNATRIFHVASGAELELDKLVLAYGAANDPEDGSNRNGSGGAILNEGGTLKLFDSSVINSRADHNGGGIYNQAGTLLLVRSTISGNYVSDNGGAIINEQGTMTLANVTISSNFAGKNGGGLFLFGGTSQLTHVTLYNNNSGRSGSGLVNTQNAKVTLQNTIVANNLAGGAPVTGDCAGAVTDGGNNLQFPDNGCGTTIKVADPQLSGLADNGGFVLTDALKPGSPAIDTASGGPCSADPVNAIDARQVKRPVGNACDIGAYEYDPQHPGKIVVDGGGQNGSTTIVFLPGACGTPTPTPTGTPQRCAPGLVLTNSGKCICPNNQVYDPQTGKCFIPQCPQGTINIGGKCLTPTPTLPPGCPINTSFVNGQCLPQQPQCPQGTVDMGGKCVTPVPPPPQCPQGTINVNGKCLTPTPLPPQCPAGQVPDAIGKCCPVNNGYDINPKTGLCEQHPG